MELDPFIKSQNLHLAINFRAVQIWSRVPKNSGGTKLSNPTEWGLGPKSGLETESDLFESDRLTPPPLGAGQGHDLPQELVVLVFLAYLLTHVQSSTLPATRNEPATLS